MVKYAVLILILLDVLLNVTGQLSLKYGMSKIGNFSLSLSTLPPVFLKAATNLPVLFGLLCYGLGFMVWLIVLSKAEVSYAYPLISLGYVFTAILARAPVRRSGGPHAHGGHSHYLFGGVHNCPQLSGPRGIYGTRGAGLTLRRAGGPASRLARQVALFSKEHG